MAAISPSRVIIDTDPGIDDVLAVLLALSARPEELELLLISVSYGNVGVQSCLRNVVAMFHVLAKEKAWRKEQGNMGFLETMSKPIVAVGADHPLEEEQLMADYYHGIDGLAGVHETHPHLSPSEAWQSLFTTSETQAASEVAAEVESHAYFTPSQEAAHLEILRLLRENPPATITLICIGPMTNAALAAAADPETFLRVKEVVVMGGAIDVPGNITPAAEFNSFADAVASARVLALTSPNPRTTMPPILVAGLALPPYPAKLSKPLSLTLFPLDITTPHLMRAADLDGILLPLVQKGSPLAEWVHAFVSRTIAKVKLLTESEEDPGMELHDAVCTWYAMTSSSTAWMMSPNAPEDIRVETAGQWTRGMHVIDRRLRRKIGQDIIERTEDVGSESLAAEDDDIKAQASSDNGSWLQITAGNRVNRMITSPGEEAFGKYLLQRIFG